MYATAACDCMRFEDFREHVARCPQRVIMSPCNQVGRYHRQRLTVNMCHRPSPFLCLRDERTIHYIPLFPFTCDLLSLCSVAIVFILLWGIRECVLLLKDHLKVTWTYLTGTYDHDGTHTNARENLFDIEIIKQSTVACNCRRMHYFQ